MKKLYSIAIGIFSFMFLAVATMASATTVEANGFGRTLVRGASGEDVKLLQAFLSADSDIYTNVINGQFGPATQKAVIKFQLKSNLKGDGIVGPRTVNALKNGKDGAEIAIERDANGNGQPCVIVPPGHLIAPGWLRKNANNIPVVPACQSIPPGIAKKLGGNFPPDNNNPDITAPVISAIVTTDIGANTVRVNWTTNEFANSKVYYSATNPVNVSTALVVSDGIMVKNHSLVVTGLSANTNYYFVVESKDAANNTTISAQNSFLTAMPDVVAPVISLGAVSDIAINSAKINWSTNESTTGKVYYSNVNPVNIATATVAIDNELKMNHTLGISGLSNNTTYYFVVEARDGANNMVLSTQGSFTTAVGDITPPVVSAISISGLTATTASVNWITNESATSKVYYSATSPVDVNTAASVTGSVSVGAHVVNITGLSANTRYYFIIESTDASGNMVRSSEQQFVTLII